MKTPLESFLPRLPAFNPARFACAQITLQREIDHYKLDRATDEEVADKTISDCEDALRTLSGHSLCAAARSVAVMQDIFRRNIKACAWSSLLILAGVGLGFAANHVGRDTAPAMLLLGAMFGIWFGIGLALLALLARLKLELAGNQNAGGFTVIYVLQNMVDGHWRDASVNANEPLARWAIKLKSGEDWRAIRRESAEEITK